MAKKKIYLTEQQKKDLEGFEDLLDLFSEGGAEIRSNNENQIEDYEIYDFLEKENLRLEKLDQFFTTHLPVAKAYQQTSKLIENEEGILGPLRNDLVNLIENPKSHFYKFIDILARKSFS